MTSLRYLLLCAASWWGAAHAFAQVPLGVDPSFEAPFDLINGVEGGYIADMERLDNGHLVVSGKYRFPGDLTWYSLCVLTANGDLVTPTFSTQGGGGGGIMRWNDQMYVRATGHIRRFFQNGVRDTAFNMSQNIAFLNHLQPGEYHVAPDGSVLYAGVHQIFDEQVYPAGNYCLIKLTESGLFDTTFQHRHCDGSIITLRPTGDGRFWCSGVLSEYDGQPVGRLFRIWPDGELDTTFNSPLTNGMTSDILRMPNDRLILAGNFVIPGIPDTLYLIRIMPDGSLDGSFHNGSHLEWFDPDLIAFATGGLCLQPLGDAHIAIGGQFWTVDGERRGALAVVDTAGTLSDDFMSYYGCDSVSGGPDDDREYGFIGGMEILGDGELYIYGEYTGFDDGTWYPGQRMITRLLPLDVGIPVPALLGFTLVPYPIPSTGAFTLSYSAQAIAGEMEVRDLAGRVVRLDRLPPWSTMHRLTLEGKASGLYNCTVRWGARSSSVRILIER